MQPVKEGEYQRLLESAKEFGSASCIKEFGSASCIKEFGSASCIKEFGPASCIKEFGSASCIKVSCDTLPLHTRCLAFFTFRRLPSGPPPPQVSEFFTLADLVASLQLHNLILQNMCGTMVAPDPVHLPLVGFLHTTNLYCIKFSR